MNLAQLLAGGRSARHARGPAARHEARHETRPCPEAAVRVARAEATPPDGDAPAAPAPVTAIDLAHLVELAETAREVWRLHADRKAIADALGSSSNEYVVELVTALRENLAQLLAAARLRVRLDSDALAEHLRLTQPTRRRDVGFTRDAPAEP